MSLRSLIIRFKPFGRIHAKQYRVVLAQKYRAVNKLYIENLGWYNPDTKSCELKEERIKELLKNNVEVSDSVISLFKKKQIIK
jgi:small subunit ribosomal protein S16